MSHLYSLVLSVSPHAGTPVSSLTNAPGAENKLAFVTAGNHMR